MPNLNCCHLIGNLTRDPELKYTPKGTAVAQIGLAINRTFTVGDTGEKREETTFIDCEAFGKTAEVIGQYVKKGDPLFIHGRLKLDQWEKDGERRSKLKVIVEGFQFLTSRRQQSDPSAPDPSDRPPSEAPRPPRDPVLDDVPPDDLPY